MPINYTRLKGITNVNDTDLLSEIETNLKSFIDWSLLGAGGWLDVNIPQTGVGSGVESTLRYTSDPSYTDGQVWEGFRKDWVWETGVEFDDDGNNPEPINITGVKVNGTYYPSGDSTYGWHINYPLGRVIFSSAIPTTSVVQCDYSYRWTQTYIADNAPWWFDLQYRSYNAEDLHFIQTTQRGDWSIGAHQRVQMPSIVIECIAKDRSYPYELGNSALRIEQDVDLNIITENRSDRNKLLAFLREQKYKTIYLYDSDSMIAGTGFPLDYRGMRIGSKMYPTLVSPVASGGYRWKKCYISDTNIFSVESWHPNLHEGKVRWTLEVVKGDM